MNDGQDVAKSDDSQSSETSAPAQEAGEKSPSKGRGRGRNAKKAAEKPAESDAAQNDAAKNDGAAEKPAKPAKDKAVWCFFFGSSGKTSTQNSRKEQKPESR